MKSDARRRSPWSEVVDWHSCRRQAGSNVPDLKSSRLATRPATGVVWLLAVVGLASAVRLLGWYWPGSFFHNAASGTWAALAWDFAHGEFYRPLVSASGFGGTRYMPVLFMLHGLLIRFHVDPIPAGVVLMQGSVVMLALALYLLLLAEEVAPAMALPFALMPWATVTYQKFSTDLRVDYLAAAFVVAAFAAASVARRDERQRWVWCAGAACVLATFSKFTEIVFLVPVALVVASGRRRTRGAYFLCAVLAACVLVFAAVQWTSAGRFMENLQATITAGAHASDFWRRGVLMFMSQLAGDPAIGAPFVLAVWASVVAMRRHDWAPADTYFVVAALVTCAIYASPGTSSNHMIEVQAAATSAVAVATARARLANGVVAVTYGGLVIVMIVLALALPWLPSPMRTLRRLGPHQRSTVDAIRADFLSAPYLSLDPIVPVLLHDRPIVLDPFNLNLFVVEHAPAEGALTARIRTRAFATIIVDDDEGVFARDLEPGTVGFSQAAARFWGAATPLVKLIGADYEIRAIRRPFVILRRRGEADRQKEVLASAGR